MNKDSQRPSFAAYGRLGGNIPAPRKVQDLRREAKGERRHIESLFKNAPFPLYGLPPHWEGGRFLGGGRWGSVLDVETVDALSLVHGSIVEGASPTLTVETAFHGGPGGGNALRAVGELVWRAQVATVSQAVEMLRERSIHLYEALSPLPSRGDAGVYLDGQTVVFDVLFQPERFVGHALVAGHELTIGGWHFELDRLNLDRISDLSPYILGTRIFETGLE
jgi:hypothetical protein